MDSLTIKDLAVVLLKCLPFLLSAWFLYDAKLAIKRGHTSKHSKGGPKYRAKSPIQFWGEMVTQIAIAIGILIMGVAFSGFAPNWYIDWLIAIMNPH